jgi:hypothetical protein
MEITTGYTYRQIGKRSFLLIAPDGSVCPLISRTEDGVKARVAERNRQRASEARIASAFSDITTSYGAAS